MNMSSQTIAPSPPQTTSSKKQRLLALDAFRGLTLLGMVLVNSPGDPHFAYPAVKHVAWHGWAFADLVFPFFLFIVGVAVPYSVESRRARGATGGRIVLHVLKRAVVLFSIGLVMNWYHKLDPAHPALDLPHLRFFNVLQRIAICSVLLTMLYLWCKPRTQAVIAVMILAGYFVLMKFVPVPVPGYGLGVLDKVGNWAQFIDSHVMGAHCGSVEQGQFLEGKGLLTTLPALITSLLGLWTGRYLRGPAPTLEKLVNLYFFGTAAMLAGAFWDNFFPINQNLWTSSLVMFMGGMAMVVFASCYYLADFRKITWWTPPFVVMGTNSLAVWIGSVTVNDTLEKIKPGGAAGKVVDLKTHLYNGLVPWLGPWNGSLAFAVLYVLFWLAVMGVFYRKKIFFKI
jgi:predicted acyltransferase